MARRSGFNLVELVAALGLASLLLALGFSGQKPPSGPVQAQALSQVLAQTLGQVRQQAISSGQPLRGEVRPRIERLYNWSKDFPQAAFNFSPYPGAS